MTPRHVSYRKKHKEEETSVSKPDNDIITGLPLFYLMLYSRH